MTDTFLQNTLLFTRALKQAGLPLSLEQTADFSRALTLINIGSRDQVYHTARSLLVTRHEHLRLFETIFNRFWRKPEAAIGQGQKMPIAPRHKRPSEQRYDIVSLMARRAQASDKEIEVADKSGTFSHAEMLQRKEFSEMSPEELETIKQLIQEMKWQMSLRRTRRRVPHKQGDTLHLRQIMRTAAKYNGVPVQLLWQRRKVKERPFVLLADVSGSMEKYARLILQFFYSVSHSLRSVECFVFGTRLTRITPQLKLKNIDTAINEAAREVFDWAGGTRIGDSLKTFNQQWSRRVLRRGAVVLIISDGWERGDVSALTQEMRYLQHRCHRLIWLNPLSGRDSYRPAVEGMAAALPYVDDFLPIHNLQSLNELAQHLAQLPS
ncbi:MAG: VWA domain-containing protein [Ardenticatenaceae bacterium]|nr:VWA domain-containing protein [Ardenticatenaceae bacterium]